jgi:hypothetical protein
LLRDHVDGIDQGGIFVLPGEYLSGVHRAKTNPVDGQLYLSGMYGWGNYSIQPGAFQRLRFTGDDVLVPVGFHVFTNGVRVDFSNRIDSDSAQDASKHFAQCWNYRYSPGYGSKEYSVFNPTIAGHDRLNVTSSHVLNNGKSLFLEIPSLQKCNQLHLHLNVKKEEETDSSVLPIDLYLTVHAMDRSFTGFENAIAVTSKVELPHPLKRDLDRLQKSVPNRWRNRLEGARTITIDAKDSFGKAVSDFTTIGGAGLTTISIGGGTITKAQVDGALSIGDLFTGGVKTYQAQMTTAGTFNVVVSVSGSTTKSATAGYSITGGDASNADVLKSIVALIASINKQIQALQKLILRR